MARPGVGVLGSIPPDFTRPGGLGMIGRSGTHTMTTSRILSRRGIGQSTLVHIGGDFLTGRNPHEWLKLLLDDEATTAVAYLGELGGQKEYAMLDLIAGARKPVYAMIAGRHAPMGKTMGHAGALAGAERETAKAKAEALAEAGARVARTPYELAALIETDMGMAESA
jgi:succinyl-CoA synthetase alpha subunit